MIKKVKNIFSRKEKSQTLKRKNLEKKAVEAAQEAVVKYRRVFERLAEYDRT